jgi:hypothetical protein
MVIAINANDCMLIDCIEHLLYEYMNRSRILYMATRLDLWIKKRKQKIEDMTERLGADWYIIYKVFRMEYIHCPESRRPLPV